MRARHPPLSSEAGTSAGSDLRPLVGRLRGAVDINKRTSATLGSTAVSVWCFPRRASSSSGRAGRGPAGRALHRPFSSPRPQVR